MNKCAVCPSPVHRWIIHRVDAAGSDTVAAGVCSLVCLLKWGYNETLMQGAQGALQAKSALDSFLAMFKGGGG